jgi:3-oxoadipate enol-lactonase
VTLHYRLDGDPASRPLLAFVNSLGTDLRIWDDVAADLQPHFALLMHDARGHGLSSVGETPYAIETLAADLAALVEHVGARLVVVCGLSVGGQVALALSRLRPDLVAALVLCDTAPKIGDAASWNARIAAIEAGGMEAIADTIVTRWFAPGFPRKRPAEYGGYRAMLTRQSPDGYIATCVALGKSDLTATARAVVVPTLCLVGAHDASTPPPLVEAMAALIPGAEYRLIPDAGHLPPIERSGALAEIIRTFASRVAMESLSHVAH